MGEVGGIIRARQSTVYVLSCDAGASAAKEAFHVSQVRLIGNGGTNMGVGIRAAETSVPAPDVIIVITDGDTSWPDKGPEHVPVIIVLVGSGSTPRWARKVIEVDPTGRKKKKRR